MNYIFLRNVRNVFYKAAENIDSQSMCFSNREQLKQILPSPCWLCPWKASLFYQDFLLLKPVPLSAIVQFLWEVLTLYRMGGKKPPPPSPSHPLTSFSPVTTKNVGLSPQNFLTFSFNPFATLLQSFKVIPSASPKLLNLNQDHPSKKWFFWSNPYKIDVMVTSLIEMLELPNFGHMTTSII